MLRTSVLLLSICALATMAGAQQSPSAASLTPAEKAGRILFQTRCAMCHVGQQPATEMATDRGERRPATLGPLLSRANASNEASLREKIKEGGPLMPGYKYALTDEQIEQVMAFMKTIDHPLTRLALARAGG